MITKRPGSSQRAMKMLFTVGTVGAHASNVLREIVRLQIESGEDQEVIDSVDGFDLPDCAARVLMGIARG